MILNFLARSNYLLVTLEFIVQPDELQAGGYDTHVKHGGCPVMIGSKWITNKWIRVNAQMFKRPCPG